MLDTYRAVLGLPGALRFSLSGLVGRLPISMVGLGIVVLVSSRTGSYALAGSISATYTVANAATAIVLARLIDRRGQRPVMTTAILVFAASLVALMAAVEQDLPPPVPHVCAALAGSALPSIGAAVRARWSHLLRAEPDKRRLQTAFALEAVNDEAVFVLGPTIVTLLATAVHPLSGLTVAALAGLAGTLALVSQRSTEPPVVHHDDATGPRPAMPWTGLAWMVVCGLLLGVLFGGAEVATVAFADEAGTKAAAGPLLAVWALGSLLSGLITGAMTMVRSAEVRFRRGLVVLTLLMLPLPLVEGLLLMGVLLFLAGFAISPTLIAAVSWVEETVPAGRLTEGMTVFSTGLVAGVAPGAALVGVVVDAQGASASYLVTAGAGVLATVVAWGVAAARRVRSPVGAGR